MVSLNDEKRSKHVRQNNMDDINSLKKNVFDFK